jgi:hypothetical protein
MAARDPYLSSNQGQQRAGPAKAQLGNLGRAVPHVRRVLAGRDQREAMPDPSAAKPLGEDLLTHANAARDQVHRAEILGFGQRPGVIQPEGLRCRADDSFPGEDPVLAPEVEYRRGCSAAPGLDLASRRAITVPGYRAADTIGVRPDQQLAVHRADMGRAEFYRVGAVRSPGSHVAIPG